MGLVTTNLTMPERKAMVEVLGGKAKWADRKRKGGDAVMTPDRGFVKQLKKLDEEFEVVWDWGKEVWEIWRFPKEMGRKPAHLVSVQTKGKGYRELGADVLLKLQEGDWNRFSLKEIVAYFDEMDDQVQRRKEKAFRDKIEAIARDTFTNVHCKIIQVPREMKIGRAING